MATIQTTNHRKKSEEHMSFGMSDTGGIFPRAGERMADPIYGDGGNVPEWMPDELVTSADADDVSGNGVFSPKGDKNVNSGQGVFSGRYSMPGYAARETGLGPSEVVDQQTGEPIEVFMTGFRNTRPTTAQVQHRWPLVQGIDTPPSAPMASRIDYQRMVGARSTAIPKYATRPVAPTFIQPGRSGTFKKGAAGFGDFSVSSVFTTETITYALVGAVAGALLAYGYDQYKKGAI